MPGREGRQERCLEIRAIEHGDEVSRAEPIGDFRSRVLASQRLYDRQRQHERRYGRNNGLPKQDEGARLVAKRVVHAAVRLLNALLDDRQIVRPVHRLERPRVRLVVQERPGLGFVLDEIDRFHQLRVFGALAPDVVAPRERRPVPLRKSGALRLEGEIEVQDFTIEVARERIRPLQQRRLHPLALGGADLAQPPVLQHRERTDEHRKRHRDDDSARQPGEAHEMRV